MSGGLHGARVALLEARFGGELAELVRRHGGEPRCAPAVREAALDCRAEVGSFVTALAAGAFSVVIFSTGGGAAALCDEAARLERMPELLAALRRVTVICRGPKPTAVLIRHQVPVTIGVREPYTTAEVIEAVATLDLGGVGVGLLHYGERNAPLLEALAARGARVEELCLYEWRLPEDVRPLEELVSEVIGGRYDAVAFTSQIQARHLFEIAARLGRAGELARALNARTVVAAIGPTCAAALESLGVRARVVPSPPKMGRLVAALAEYRDGSRNDV